MYTRYLILVPSSCFWCIYLLKICILFFYAFMLDVSGLGGPYLGVMELSDIFMYYLIFYEFPSYFILDT